MWLVHDIVDLLLHSSLQNMMPYIDNAIWATNSYLQWKISYISNLAKISVTVACLGKLGLHEDGSSQLGRLVSLSSVIVQILTLILSFFCYMSFAVCSLKGRLLATAIFRTVSAVSCIYLIYVFCLCRHYIFVKDSASLSVSVESLSTKN